MKNNEAQSCLKTFLEVSQIQIDMRNKSIKRRNSIKTILSSDAKKDVNLKLEKLIEERNKIQGMLDCVRLEILDMILDDQSLISEKMLAKKGYTSVLDFVKIEKEKIELRDLYKQYPCSIKDVLDVALLNHYPTSKEDVLASVNNKNVKIMTKSL